MNPVGVDQVPEALKSGEISIGWPNAVGLMDATLDYWRFREVLKEAYFPDAKSYAKAGPVASQLWLFIREMSEGDLVAVPHGGQFYVASVAGPAVYRPEKAVEHAAFRRNVIWLNAGKGIPRSIARAALQSRLKDRHTCARASDLVDAISDALDAGSSTAPPSFGVDLRSQLIDAAKREMASGRMDSYGFENLIATILRSLGAADVRVVARSKDKGADLLATFSLAGTFPVRVAIQAKHYRPDPPVGPHVVDQLVAGMDAEEVALGWVATSGTFSSEAVERKDQLEDERGLQIELVDGDQLAAMIVEGGLRAVGFHAAESE